MFTAERYTKTSHSIKIWL